MFFNFTSNEAKAQKAILLFCLTSIKNNASNALEYIAESNDLHKCLLIDIAQLATLANEMDVDETLSNAQLNEAIRLRLDEREGLLDELNEMGFASA